MKQSESITNIAKALQIFHLKVGKVLKDSTNPFFKSKYAGLPNVLDAISTPLMESGLIFTQFPNEDGLCTSLIHAESGEYMQAHFKMTPVKNDPQAQGSAITYARRYALVSILGLNVDDDDDGNKASGNTSQEKQATARDDGKAWLNKDSTQWTEAMKFLQNGGTIEQIKKKYRISKENQELITNSI